MYQSDLNAMRVVVANSSQKHSAPVNEQLNFAMAGYVDAHAKPGAIPDPITAAFSLMEMYRYAQHISNRQLGEEVLSRTFHQIAQSKLTERYKSHSLGVRPYINTIMRRTAGKIFKEIQKEYGQQRQMPANFDAASRELDPCTSLQIAELTDTCEVLLKRRVKRRKRKANSAVCVSTKVVRKHRKRKARWQKVAHLFPFQDFRPQLRRV